MKRFAHILTIASLSLLCTSPLLANYSPFPDRASISMLPSILLLDFSSDAFFVLVSLLILGQASKIRLGTLLMTFVLVMLAGFAADGIALKLVSNMAYSSQRNQSLILICIPLIGLANYCIARFYTGLSDRQSLVMGIIISIFTVPIGSIAIAIPETSRFGFNSENFADTAYSYAIIGIIFAVISIILLYYIKPITSLDNRRISAVGLLVVAGFSYFTLKPIVKARYDNRQIFSCSTNMWVLTHAFWMYKDDYNDYPPDLGSIPSRYIKRANMLHCPLDKNSKNFTSYEYRKPPKGIDYESPYWILKCTHHPNYNLYVNIAGKPLKALPKNESYK